jgi:hypothetical protein
VSGLTTPYVLDTGAAGTLFITDARLESFEENSGQTNTTTVRLEANGVFVVHRVGAIAEAVVGS